MRQRYAWLWAICLTVGPSPLLSVATATDDPPPAVLIIVNADVDAALTARQLRSMYTMRLRHWPDGQPVRPMVLPDQNPLHISFAEHKLGIFPHVLRRTWDRLVFSGTGQAPLQTASEAEMIAKVASTPGAIGYVSATAPVEGVRVIDPNAGDSL